MGFLNNTSITVDAVLTKKGRELLARGQDEFKITKFALADDEVDYRLWDTAHPNGSNYYGAVIENMPILESFVDENQIMRFKLVSLPKNTAKLPILEIGAPNVTLTGPGITQTISPNTRNSGGGESYAFTLHDATIANITPVVSVRTTPKETPAQRRNRLRRANLRRRGAAGLVDGLPLGGGPRPGGRNIVSIFPEPEMAPPMEEIELIENNVGATTPVFTNEEERKRSITIEGKSINLVSRSVTTDSSTNLTVTGLSTGASFNVAVTVKADPSTL